MNWCLGIKKIFLLFDKNRIKTQKKKKIRERIPISITAVLVDSATMLHIWKWGWRGSALQHLELELPALWDSLDVSLYVVNATGLVLAMVLVLPLMSVVTFTYWKILFRPQCHNARTRNQIFWFNPCLCFMYVKHGHISWYHNNMEKPHLSMLVNSIVNILYDIVVMFMSWHTCASLCLAG